MAVDESIVEAMRAWGAKADDLARAQTLADAAAPDDDKPFELWPENADSLNVFRALGTQWIYAGEMQPRRVGMRYEGVIAWLENHIPRRKKRRSLMNDLQAMELAVLQADRELRAEKEE